MGRKLPGADFAEHLTTVSGVDIDAQEDDSSSWASSVEESSESDSTIILRGVPVVEVGPDNAASAIRRSSSCD